MSGKQLFIGILILLIISGCRQKSGQDAKIVATIYDRKITEHEFRMFYELDPNFGIFNRGLNELKKELNLCMAQIAAARKAEDDNLLSDVIFSRAVEWERKQATLRELFRQEVLDRIQVSEDDLKREYIKENTQVHVRHIFSKSAEMMKDLQHKLKTGTSFELLALQTFTDSLLAKCGGDLGWMRLDDLDDDFAEAITCLDDKEISGIVKTKWGYHIIQLLDKKENLILRQDEYEKRKQVLQKKIQRSRGKALGSEYVKSIMRELNPQPDEKGFLILWRLLTQDDGAQQTLPNSKSITSKEIESGLHQLSAELNKPLIRFNNSAISIGEFLESMKHVPIGHRPEFRTMRELSVQIALWARDTILYQRALREGLQHHAQVEEEVRRFVEEQSFGYYMQELLQNIEIPAEVKTFYKTKNISLLQTRPYLKKYHTLQDYSYHLAQEQLINELLEYAGDFTVDMNFLQAENQGIDWNQRIRMFMIRKPE